METKIVKDIFKEAIDIAEAEEEVNVTVITKNGTEYEVPIIIKTYDKDGETWLNEEISQNYDIKYIFMPDTPDVLRLCVHRERKNDDSELRILYIDCSEIQSIEI